MYISMQTYILNISQAIAAFISVIFLYLELIMVIFMFKSMWNRYMSSYLVILLYFLNTY